MSYRVDYYTLAVLDNGEIGLFCQEQGHVFTDLKIEKIQDSLNDYLKPKKRIGIIKKIEDIGGKCL